MELGSYFTKFIRDISPSRSDRTQYQDRHRELSELLKADDELESAIVSTFLQGSYRRATLTRPQPGSNADVDLVVVTKLSEADNPPEQAIQRFVPFLERHYSGKFELQGRSLGIELDDVSLDLVPTSAPSEAEIGILQSDAVVAYDTPEDVNDWRLVKSWVAMANRSIDGTEALLKAAMAQEEWQLEPLRIPDRELKTWQPTHPLAQIKWTHEKNGLTNGHYIHVVKCIKWWWAVKHVDLKYPKGYPVEHLIGLCCPDDIVSVAEGVTLTLEGISSAFRDDAAASRTPVVPDHGVPEQNVFGRVSGEDFARFHGNVTTAASLARRALNADNVQDSAVYWQELFGDSFPMPPGDGGSESPHGPKGGFTPPKKVAVLGGGRFA